MDNISLWTSPPVLGDSEPVPTSAANSTVIRMRWGATALGLIVLATAFGNVLLCLAVITEHRLRNMTNYFLASLAVADLLVAVVVMPPAVAIEIYDGYFPLGNETCIVWATMDVLLCTASIWHMATISVDRYCSLRFPLRYRRTKSPVFVVAKIAFVWIVSVGICSSLFVAGLINPTNIYHDGHCVPAVSEFIIYGSIFAFYVPLVVMFVTYALTVRTLQSRTSKSTPSTWRQKLHQHAVVAHHLAQRSTILTRTVNSSDNEDVHRTMSGTRASVFRGSWDDTTQTACCSASTTTTDLPRNIDEEDEFVADWNSGGGDRTVLYGEESARTRHIATTVSPSSGGDRAQHTSSRGTVGPTSSRENRGGSSSDGDDARMQRNFSGTCCHSHVTAVDVLPAEEKRPTSNTTCGGPCHTTLKDDVELGRSNKLVTWGSGHHRAPSVQVDDSPSHSQETSREHVRTSKPVRRHTSPDEMTKNRENLATAAVQTVSSGRTKRKATRVLGVMFVVFVVLWTPFFALNLLSAACPGCVQSVDPTVWTVLVWFGWISSLANPIIYTSFSPAFRAAFRRLLTCQGRRGLSTAKRRQQQWTDLIRCRHPSLSTN